MTPTAFVLPRELRVNPGDHLPSVDGSAQTPSAVPSRRTHHSGARNHHVDLACRTRRAWLPAACVCRPRGTGSSVVSSGGDAVLTRVENVRLRELKE